MDYSHGHYIREHKHTIRRVLQVGGGLVTSNPSRFWWDMCILNYVHMWHISLPKVFSFHDSLKFCTRVIPEKHPNLSKVPISGSAYCFCAIFNEAIDNFTFIL